MKILLQVFMLATLLFAIPSCKWFTHIQKPFIWLGGGYQVPEGTALFKIGYIDGCDEIFYSRGNLFYRTFHSLHLHHEFNRETEYRFGYKRGRIYCFSQMTPGMTSFDRALFPKKDAYYSGFVAGGFGAEDYDKATDGMFGGLDPIIPSRTVDGIFADLREAPAGSVFGANALWAGGSKGQFFGQE